MRQKAIKTPPLCLAMLNIGEVAHSDGGVNPYTMNLFQLLSSETAVSSVSLSYPANATQGEE